MLITLMFILVCALAGILILVFATLMAEIAKSAKRAEKAATALGMARQAFLDAYANPAIPPEVMHSLQAAMREFVALIEEQ